MMQCGGLACKKVFDYTLMNKSMLVDGKAKNFWYAGVLCPQCNFTHRISPIYFKKSKAVEQVKVHNHRVSKIQ